MRKIKLIRDSEPFDIPYRYSCELPDGTMLYVKYDEEIDDDRKWVVTTPYTVGEELSLCILDRCRRLEELQQRIEHGWYDDAGTIARERAEKAFV